MISIRLIKNYESGVTLYYTKNAKLLHSEIISEKLPVINQAVTAFLVDSWHLENHQRVQTISSPLASLKSIKRDITLKMQIF